MFLLSVQFFQRAVQGRHRAVKVTLCEGIISVYNRKSRYIFLVICKFQFMKDNFVRKIKEETEALNSTSKIRLNNLQNLKTDE